MEALKHSDCRNFATVDVAKGICRRTGALVSIDTATCPCLNQLPKCKNCAHYTDKGDNLGTCEAQESKPWAFAEMVAVTCTMYEEKKAQA